MGTSRQSVVEWVMCFQLDCKAGTTTFSPGTLPGSESRLPGGRLRAGAVVSLHPPAKYGKAGTHQSRLICAFRTLVARLIFGDVVRSTASCGACLSTVAPLALCSVCFQIVHANTPIFAPGIYHTMH